MGEKERRARQAPRDVLVGGPMAWTLDGDLEGFTSAESLRDEWLRWLDAEDRDVARAALDGWVLGQSDDFVFEGRVASASGEAPRWVEVAGSVVLRAPDGRPIRLAGTRRDVTARHEARLALQRARDHAEKLLQETGELAGVGGWSFDVAAQQLDWTPMTRRIHEVDEDFVPTVADAVAFYAPESRPIIGAAVERALGDGTPFDVELRLVTAKSRSIWVRAVGRAEWRGGSVARLVGAFQDVSEQRARATALRDAWSKTQRYLDTVQTVIVALDADLRVTMANRHACDLLGRAGEELVGRDWLEICAAPDSAALHAAAVRAALAGLDSRDREVAVRCLDGTERLVSWRATRMVDAVTGASGVLLSGEDVTGVRELEQRVARTQRLEAIGTLAGGLAHDLNNALTPITLALDVLAASRGQEDALLSMLTKSAAHAAGIVRQLLTFARGARAEKVELQPAAVVGELTDLVASVLPKNITLKLAVGARLPTVEADPTQLQQILLNLCVNARDAMPRGGTMEIQVVSARLEREPAETHWGAPFTPGPYVVFRVVDTGAGIPAGVRERIVDPFFTTKSLEGGSGLGLSMVLGLTKAHGGFLSVASTVDVGSTFAVYLPAASADGAGDPSSRRDELPRSAAPPAPASDGERDVLGAAPPSRGSILFVDDEPLVGHVSGRILTDAGFRVEVFVSGAQALAAFRADPARWDVLVTDLHMPELSGDRVAREARALAPALAVVIVSGFFEQRDASDADWPERCVRLNKPFSPERLIAAIDAARSLRSLAQSSSAANPVSS
jgi:PAS domain S-box-containing protein